MVRHCIAQSQSDDGDCDRHCYMSIDESTQVEQPPVTKGDLIRIARNWRGIDRQDLSDRLGVHPNTLGGWENNAWAPKRMALRVVADELRVPLDWLEAGADLPTGRSGDYAGWLELVAA